MKIIIENIGVFKYAEYDLADLTIICGKNNTGKTYATYCLYGFIDYFRQGYNIIVPQKSIKELFENGTLVINLDISQKAIDGYLEDACNRFLKFLPRIFSAQERYFKETRVHVKVNANEICLPNEFEQSYRSNKKEFLQIIKSKEKNELLVSLLLNDEEYDDNTSLRITISHIISDALKNILFSNIFQECFIASAERTGAVIFKDELNVPKNTLLREVAHSNNIDIEDILNKVYNILYALPVRRNIDFVRNLESISKGEGELHKQHPDIIKEFESIVGGTYKVSKEGLFFYPNKYTKLSIRESSSSVRSLLDVYFYLRYIAKSGQLLMIDEPELNLHPECQRKLARLLARLVNYGVRVFITTHSDYIIKEFNTLLMLYSRKDNKTVLKQISKYGYQQEEYLSTAQVKMFISKKENILLAGNHRKTKAQTLIPASINPYFGIEAVSFDETINEMNAIQESIMFNYGSSNA